LSLGCLEDLSIQFCHYQPTNSLICAAISSHSTTPTPTPTPTSSPRILTDTSDEEVGVGVVECELYGSEKKVGVGAGKTVLRLSVRFVV